MSKTITILNGHPDSDPARLCNSIAKHYARGAEEAGYKVNLLEVGKLDFVSVLSTVDHAAGHVPRDITLAQNMVRSADRVVLIFPLWLGTMPGVFKMLLEQIFRPGFSHEYTKKGWPNGLLKGKTADVIVSMGMPALAYKWFFRAHGLKNLKRNILHFAGIKPVQLKLIGGVDKLTSEQADELFDDIERLGAR